MFKINYNVRGEEQQIVTGSKAVAASTIASLRAKGINDINVTAHEGAHELKDIMAVMSLADSLELIEAFKAYIKIMP
jgi:hypothetical protein